MAEKVETLECALQKINSQTGGKFFDLQVKSGYCPSCGLGALNRKGPDLVCVQCGYVVDQEHFSFQIPFGFEHSPGSKLAVGKGCGSTIWERGTWALLSKSNEVFTCPNCGAEFNDLPIRARQMMTFQQKLEHPTMIRLLLLGQRRSVDWGYDQPKTKERDRMFAENYGDLLRWVGAGLVVRNQRINFQRVVDACLALCLRRLEGEQRFLEVVEKLGVDEPLLKKIVVLAGGQI
jgi:hypothetical protein